MMRARYFLGLLVLVTLGCGHKESSPPQSAMSNEPVASNPADQAIVSQMVGLWKGKEVDPFGSHDVYKEFKADGTMIMTMMSTHGNGVIPVNENYRVQDGKFILVLGTGRPLHPANLTVNGDSLTIGSTTYTRQPPGTVVPKQ